MLLESPVLLLSDGEPKNFLSLLKAPMLFVSEYRLKNYRHEMHVSI